MAAVTDEITMPYNFVPWPHQDDVFVAFYEHGIRRFCEVIHRRGGKDKMALNLMIDQMTQRVGNYCHVFPQRNRARLIVWEGIDSDGLRYIDHFPPELVHRKLEQDMMISMVHPDDEDREGSIYRCMGSDKDVHLLVGTNPIGIIWSEYPEINPRMRELALPIIRRNNGWEIIVFTPRGRNHGYRVYQQVKNDPDWHSSYLPIDKTMDNDGNALMTDEDVEADIRAGMNRETANQEYYLAWDSPMPGAYYADEFRSLDRDGRIMHVPYDPTLPVYTAWDLGRNDVNAIWFFQPAGHEVRFIDYEEGASVALAKEDPDNPSEDDGWVELVRAKPYNYDHSKLPQPTTKDKHEIHYGPHDLKVHEYSTGKTRYGYALQRGLHFTVLPHPGPGGLNDGIEVSRKLLARTVFDEENCEKGLDAMRSYRRQWDENKLVYAKKPLHDWASNGADAFRYAAVGLMPPGEPLVVKAVDTPGTFDWLGKQVDRAARGQKPGGYSVNFTRGNPINNA